MFGFEISENEDTAFHNLRDAAKAVLSNKYIGVYTCIEKTEEPTFGVISSLLL